MKMLLSLMRIQHSLHTLLQRHHDDDHAQVRLFQSLLSGQKLAYGVFDVQDDVYDDHQAHVMSKQSKGY